MITRGAITKIADRDGVSAVVVERDYVLTHIVDSLAHVDGASGLIFKGGTALRLCFYQDFRYSADLDFTLDELETPEAIEVIRAALKLAAGSIELPSLEIPEGDPPTIRYVGPLGRERSIKVDLADDELVIKTTIARLSASTPTNPTKRHYSVHTPSRKLQARSFAASSSDNSAETSRIFIDCSCKKTWTSKTHGRFSRRRLASRIATRSNSPNVSPRVNLSTGNVGRRSSPISSPTRHRSTR